MSKFSSDKVICGTTGDGQIFIKLNNGEFWLPLPEAEVFCAQLFHHIALLKLKSELPKESPPSRGPYR